MKKRTKKITVTESSVFRMKVSSVKEIELAPQKRGASDSYFFLNLRFLSPKQKTDLSEDGRLFARLGSFLFGPCSPVKTVHGEKL